MVVSVRERTCAYEHTPRARVARDSSRGRVALYTLAPGSRSKGVHVSSVRPVC